MSVSSVNKQNGSLNLIASRGQFIQYSVMPTPSVDILNKIIQYIGTSTSSYINGYFYKCIYDETVSPAIYRWDNVSVQAGGGGSAEIIKGYFNPSDNLFYEEPTYVTPIAGDVNSLYLSLDTNLLYRYNATIFVEVSNYEIGDGLNLDDNTLSADTVIFTGTSAQWTAVVDKSKYDIVNLLDDDDDDVYTKSQVDTLLTDKANLTQISNPNLLDNPWFTINQRGQSSYPNGVYSIDRWVFISEGGNTSLSVNANGVTLAAINDNITNRIDTDLKNTLLGKTCTLSVMLADGTIYSASGTITNSGVEQIHFVNNVINIFYSTDQYYTYVGVQAKQANVTVRAVKLEVGTVSTLAMDTAPNYASELQKCQRYYINIKEHIYMLDGNGNMDAPFYNEFRETPTCTLKAADVYENESWVTIASSTTIRASNNQFVRQTVYLANPSKAYEYVRIAFEASADL